MNENPHAVAWYFKPVPVVLAVLALGPFAIPLVWHSPALGRPLKAGLVLAAIGLTVWGVVMGVRIAGVIMSENRALAELMR